MRVATRWSAVVLPSLLSLLAPPISLGGRLLAAMPPAVFETDLPSPFEGPVKPETLPGRGPVKNPPTPVVCIAVRVPAAGAPGEELEYRICVENPTFAPAHRVTVRNPLPEHAKFVRAKPEPTAREPELVWELGTLEACAKREILLVLSPTGG